MNYNATSKLQNISYERYKVTYECKASKIPDKTSPKLSGGKNYPPIKAFAIYKTKVKWNNTSNSWDNPSTDGNDATYEKQQLQII